MTDSRATSLARVRTFLFVPGNRPERFEKAWASKADIVILDLEDSVAADAKDAARDAVAAWLAPHRPIMVRINPPGSLWFEKDLALCARESVAAIAVPRAEPGCDLERAGACKPVLAIVETAVGVMMLAAIAATPGVARLGLGGIDLALDLGMSPDAVLDPVLLQMVIASRAAGIAAPVAPVTTAIRDSARLREVTARQRAMGFTAKLCIHPAQIDAVKAGLAPTAQEIVYARQVIAAAEQSKGSATVLDGQMIDRPIIDHARRIIDDAEGRFARGIWKV
jgi:citrate lyase subunit beta/citryl-CoA lyase